MADEIARLGVAVDSSPAVSAVKDLDNLAAAGDRATASAKRLSGGWESMTLSPTQLYSANRGLSAFRTEMSNAAAATRMVDQEWKKTTFSNSQLMKANQSLVTFRTEARAAAQASQQLAHAQTAQAASHHQVAKAAVGYTKSAKEMAFATRNLPAQFTDIAISLQAGQNPLTVLLQQGGQLKDMFGGVGPAARAMGGYIKGLINPFVLAAAAVAALGAAWLQGDAEGRRLNTVLVMQGNSLGVTTDGLIAASERMESFSVSQGKAAEALAATAASGKIFGSNIERVAQAAADLERTAGQDIQKTVDDFASLAQEPVQAALKLNESYKFLTVSTYETIRSLEEQGDTMGAAQVAMEALAGSIDQKTQEIEANLGTLQLAWKGVGMMAKWAWDQMLDIGRTQSIQQQMEDLGAKLREIENPSNFASFAHLGPAGSQARQKYAEQIRQQMMGLQDEYIAQQRKATKELDEQSAVQANAFLDAEIARGRNNAQKRLVETARLTTEFEKGRRSLILQGAKETDQAVIDLERKHQQALDSVNRRLADPKPKKSDAARDAERELRARAAEYERFNTTLDQHEATLRAAGEAQDRLSSFERYAVKTLSDLENGHTKLDAAQQAEMRTRIEALRVIDQQNQARDKQNRIMELSTDLHKRIASMEAGQAQSHNAELSGIGRGQNEGALEQTLEEIRIRSAEERIRLEEKYQELKATGSAQYLADLAAINDAESRLVNNEIAQMQRRKDAMADWRNGARSAMEDILWEMNDVAGRTRDGFLNAFSAMNQALNTFAQTGKISIRDFATTVIAELLKIALTIAASKILTQLFGATVSSGAGSSGETAAYNSWFQANSAQGNVMQGGRMLSTFALGGVTGTVRNSPTLFPMAGGTMLMSEQEPEAIMPLGRGPDGKLGVRSNGGGGSTISVSTQVTINTDGSNSSRTDVEGDNQEQGRKLGHLIGQKVRDVLVEERRQGGLLWAMQNGR